MSNDFWLTIDVMTRLCGFAMSLAASVMLPLVAFGWWEPSSKSLAIIAVLAFGTAGSARFRVKSSEQ